MSFPSSIIFIFADEVVPMAGQITLTPACSCFHFVVIEVDVSVTLPIRTTLLRSTGSSKPSHVFLP